MFWQIEHEDIIKIFPDIKKNPKTKGGWGQGREVGMGGVGGE